MNELPLCYGTRYLLFRCMITHLWNRDKFFWQQNLSSHRDWDFLWHLDVLRCKANKVFSFSVYKVHIFWESHKIWHNLLTFLMLIGNFKQNIKILVRQISVAFSVCRIFELYRLNSPHSDNAKVWILTNKMRHVT